MLVRNRAGVTHAGLYNLWEGHYFQWLLIQPLKHTQLDRDGEVKATVCEHSSALDKE